ncbi:MAG: GtrA family protein [Ottowia sp.]|nr:GtrA family protein [Ottowia sp.]
MIIPRISWPRSLRFIMVGTCAAAVHFVIALMAVEIGQIPPLWANVLGFCVAFCVSFLGHARLTFSQHNTPLWSALPRFFAVAVTAFACNEWLFYLCITQLAWPYQPSLALVLLVVAGGTYYASKYWAFRQTRTH